MNSWGQAQILGAWTPGTPVEMPPSGGRAVLLSLALALRVKSFLTSLGQSPQNDQKPETTVENKTEKNKRKYTIMYVSCVLILHSTNND